MGYVLFTSSGTFKPADYGLAPGDTIQITAIGGGAGGAGDHTFGTAGSASSFGSILTAPGGTACTGKDTPGALSEGMLPGLPFYLRTGYSEYGQGSKTHKTYYGLGSQGGPGWIPGEPRRYYELLLSQVMSSSNGNITANNPRAYWQGAPLVPRQQAATVIPLGATGPNWNGMTWGSNNYRYFDGPGGRGYGAGGGVAEGWAGGNSGALRHASYKLPNTNSIAVTVGNGGTGGTSTSTDSNGTATYPACAGGGARGCVAVFW